MSSGVDRRAGATVPGLAISMTLTVVAPAPAIA
jgi:hypothetical protein